MVLAIYFPLSKNFLITLLSNLNVLFGYNICKFFVKKKYCYVIHDTPKMYVNSKTKIR